MDEGADEISRQCYVDYSDRNFTYLFNVASSDEDQHSTTHLVNNFCYTMKKWRNKICLDNDFRRKKIM